MINNEMIIQKILLVHSAKNNIYESLVLLLIKPQRPFSPSLVLITYPTTSPLRGFLNLIHINALTVHKHFVKPPLFQFLHEKKTFSYYIKTETYMEKKNLINGLYK